MTRSTICAVVLLATLAHATAPAHAGDDSYAPRPDPAVKDWYQLRGNAARSAVSTFEPIRSEPEEAWRVRLVGEPCSNIVTWDGFVFVAVQNRKRKRAEVFAFRIEDGKTSGVRPLPTDSGARLAMWNGTLIVVQSGKLTYHGYRKGTFRMPVEWESEERVTGSPLVHDGQIYVQIDDESLWKMDVGKRKAEPRRIGECTTRASLSLVGRKPHVIRAWVGPHSTYRGTYISMSRGFAPTQVRIGPRQGARSSEVAVHRLGTGAGFPDGGWLVLGPVGILSTKGAEYGVLFKDVGSGFYPQDLDSEAVVLRDKAIAWTRGGELVEVSLEGSRKLMEADLRPKGFKGFELSAAQDVLYAGNAAVELASRRVLWCLPDLAATSPLIPAGDARVVVVDGDELVGLTGTTGGKDVVDGSADATADAAPPPLPKDLDGVLLTSGEQVCGAVTLLDDGGVRVTAEDGTAHDVGARDVAVATADGKAVGPRNEYLAYRICRDAAFGEIALGYRALFLDLLRERMLSAARAVLEEARGFGLSEVEIKDLGARFTGLSENPNADAKRMRVIRERRERKRELARHVDAAATWLEQRGMQRGAAALLGEIERLIPSGAGWRKRATALVPENFPFADEKDAGASWSHWSRALLPSGAQFVGPDDPGRKEVWRPPWDADTIVLRSRNVILFSRSTDADVVGGCLQRAETAVAALETLLDLEPAGDLERPLRVMLHRNREEYLAEKTPAGSAPSWSAGYYSPVERVSRFFVPAGEDSGDPLGRSLYATLAHELTHHWVDMRWATSGRGSAITPGYWVVEGIAQFVGDQAADSDPYTVRLDNHTVPSLDAMAQAAAEGKSLPVAEFVDLNQLGFAGLSGDTVVTVQLRNTLDGRRLSQRALFYEQAAALSWFLMNRRGDDGRERFRRYLWAYYHGQAPKGGWASLGFDTPDDLTKQFQAFLTELAGRPARLRTGNAAAAGPDLPEATPHAASRKPEPPPGESIPGTGEFDVGDDVWVEFLGKYRGGTITGFIDGKFWVSFGFEGIVKRVLVPPTMIKKR